jgi:hypothetical protein
MSICSTRGTTEEYDEKGQKRSVAHTAWKAMSERKRYTAKTARRTFLSTVNTYSPVLMVLNLTVKSSEVDIANVLCPVFILQSIALLFHARKDGSTSTPKSPPPVRAASHSALIGFYLQNLQMFFGASKSGLAKAALSELSHTLAGSQETSWPHVAKMLNLCPMLPELPAADQHAHAETLEALLKSDPITQYDTSPQGMSLFVGHFVLVVRPLLLCQHRPCLCAGRLEGLIQ